MKDATWVGFCERSNEHYVVLANGGPSISVRTVKPKSEAQPWNKQAILEITATPDKPNPKDHLKILNEEAGCGSRLDGYRVPGRAPAIEINLSPSLDCQYYLSSLSSPFLT